MKGKSISFVQQRELPRGVRQCGQDMQPSRSSIRKGRIRPSKRYRVRPIQRVGLVGPVRSVS